MQWTSFHQKYSNGVWTTINHGCYRKDQNGSQNSKFIIVQYYFLSLNPFHKSPPRDHSADEGTCPLTEKPTLWEEDEAKLVFPPVWLQDVCLRLCDLIVKNIFQIPYCPPSPTSCKRTSWMAPGIYIFNELLRLF